MNIIGLYGALGYDPFKEYETSWCHDSGASLFVNGTHVTSISEARLSRVKHDGRVPLLSIEYCLNAANLELKDIDFVYVCDNGSVEFIKAWKSGYILEEIKKTFPNAQTRLLNHHLCHAAGSVFASNFNEGTLVTLDGSGSSFQDAEENVYNHEQSGVGYFNKKKGILKLFQMPPFYNQFGMYYLRWAWKIYTEKVERWVDFLDPKYRDSLCGKIMGLSAYGSYDGKLDDWKLAPIAGDCPKIYLISHPNQTEKFKKILDLSPEDKALYIQKNFEDALVNYFKVLKEEKYIDDNLVLSGGVFLNILANTAIKKANIVKNLFIPPFINDCGLSLGAAAYGSFLNKEKIEFPSNLATLGIEYSNEEIENELTNTDEIEYEYYSSFPDLCEFISHSLKENKIIGWFQNKSEFGPRSLGSRSILMNPRPKENKDVINTKVKHREYWRPFAGIILEDYVEEYFEEGFKSPYMLYSQTIKSEKINSIEAICHQDNTCRIQSVNKHLHPQITKLLEKYYEIDHLPILLNTSFNDNGQPIVETPRDAIDTLKNLNIDYLAIGNFVVRKVLI